MLRDLTGEERAAYFRGIQPIWGGGLSEDRFQMFQRRLADAPEARERYRLLGWFVNGTLTAAMKAYDLRATSAARPLRVLGVGAVFTPPELRRRFRVLESRECTVAASELPRLPGSTRPALAGDEPLMTGLFAASRGDLAFALARDGWTLRFQLRRLRELARARGVGEPEWGLVAEGRSGEGAAMLRLGRDSVDVLDAAWTTDAARDCVLSGLRECLERVGRTHLRLWPAGQMRELFEAEDRTAAVAMIAPLDGNAALPERGGTTELTLLDHI